MEVERAARHDPGFLWPCPAQWPWGVLGQASQHRPPTFTGFAGKASLTQIGRRRRADEGCFIDYYECKEAAVLSMHMQQVAVVSVGLTPALITAAAFARYPWRWADDTRLDSDAPLWDGWGWGRASCGQRCSCPVAYHLPSKHLEKYDFIATAALVAASTAASPAA